MGRRKADDASPAFDGTTCSPKEVSMCCLPLCGVGLVEDDASSWGYFDALTNSIHTRRGLLPQLPSPGLGWISDSQAAVSIDRPKQPQSKICTDGEDDGNEEAKSSASNSATDEQQRLIAIKLDNAELQVRGMQKHRSRFRNVSLVRAQPPLLFKFYLIFCYRPE